MPDDTLTTKYCCMKNFILITFFILIGYAAHTQNVGIGTTSPSENLEVKNLLRSAIKITSGGPLDTTRLIFSNRNESVGTNMSLTFLREQALVVSSSSLFPYLDSDSILYMTPLGMVGINTVSPQQRLDVNGSVRSNGLLVNNDNILEFGYGLIKQTDNGKIGMNVFGEANTLSIVGGGVAADASDRRIKFWANDVSVFTGKGHFAGNVGIGTAPGSVALTLNSTTGSLLTLRNSNPLNTGITSSIFFGGSNYTTGIIQTVGNSTSNARMSFFTGYSFSGGPVNLQERLTIANNGNVGVKNSDPQATLDVGGSIRFSGANPAAFRLTLRGIMMYNDPVALSIDSVNGKWVILDHPMCNNDPNAIILVTPVGFNGKVMRVEYFANSGKWFMKDAIGFTVNGLSAGNYTGCPVPPAVIGACITLTTDKLLLGRESQLVKDDDYWNILIIKN